MDGRAHAAKPVPGIDAHNQDFDDVERGACVPRGTDLGAAHEGHRCRKASARIVFLGVDNIDCRIGVSVQDGGEPLRLRLRGANDAVAVLDFLSPRRKDQCHEQRRHLQCECHLRLLQMMIA